MTSQHPQEPGRAWFDGAGEPQEIITLYLDEVPAIDRGEELQPVLSQALQALLAATREPAVRLADPRRFTQYPSFDALAKAHGLTGEPQPDGGE